MMIYSAPSGSDATTALRLVIQHGWRSAIEGFARPTECITRRHATDGGSATQAPLGDNGRVIIDYVKELLDILGYPDGSNAQVTIGKGFQCLHGTVAQALLYEALARPARGLHGSKSNDSLLWPAGRLSRWLPRTGHSRPGFVGGGRTAAA